MASVSFITAVLHQMLCWLTHRHHLRNFWKTEGSRRAHNLHQQLQTSTIGSPHNMDKPSTSWTVWYWPLVMLEILTSSSYNAKRLSTFKNVIFSPVQSYIHIKYAHYSLWWLWYEWHWSILCSRILTPVTRMINPFDFLSKLDLLSVSLLYLLLPTNIRKFLCDCSCQSKSWYHDDVAPKFYSNKLNQIYEKGDPPSTQISLIWTTNNGRKHLWENSNLELVFCPSRLEQSSNHSPSD